MEVNGNVTTGDAVLGSSGSGAGVHGINGQGFDSDGSGLGKPSAGVCGESSSVEGVLGASTTQHGVHGISGLGSGVKPPHGCGVYGESHQWPNNAIFGSSNAGHGVHGINGAGSGTSPSAGCGVYGESATGYGVYGASKSGMAGVFVGNVSVSGGMTAGSINVPGNITAGGNIMVTGDVVLTGGDCAERFDLKTLEIAEPGTVMVIGDDGALRQSSKAYDCKVAGVVSGAGSYRPGIVLDKRADDDGRTTIALIGKVYCKVDADAGPIAVGDLLTTSNRPGHAMRVSDPLKGFGSVIGKALLPMVSGQGLLPILVALQ